MGRLYIFCGIPFSGKTTIARELASKYGFVRVDLDEVKFRLFGEEITDEEIDQLGWNEIYAKIYDEIRERLLNGETVISDTGNFTKAERKILADIAVRAGADAVEVFFDVPVNVAKRRWEENKKNKQRFNISEGSFMSAASEMEPPSGNKAIVYSYPTPVPDWLKQNFSLTK